MIDLLLIKVSYHPHALLSLGHTRLIVMYILNFDVLVFVLPHNIHTSAPAGVVAKQTFPLVCRMCHKF